MRRSAVIAILLYLGVAALTRGVEAAGLRRCHCSSTCWCRRPFLSAFHWVAPVRHR